MSAKRLLVSLDEEAFNAVTDLAKATHESLSKTAKNLIISSLELQEDQIFAKLADDRASDTKEWFSHQDAWK